MGRISSPRPQRLISRRKFCIRHRNPRQSRGLILQQLDNTMDKFFDTSLDLRRRLLLLRTYENLGNMLLEIDVKRAHRNDDDVIGRRIDVNLQEAVPESQHDVNECYAADDVDGELGEMQEPQLNSNADAKGNQRIPDDIVLMSHDDVPQHEFSADLTDDVNINVHDLFADLQPTDFLEADDIHNTGATTSSNTGRADDATAAVENDPV